jgi:TetR/AcrR family transcriptional regulator
MEKSGFDTDMMCLSRKEREKLQRRNEIIYAAEHKFFEKGFEGVAMDDIAKELELSKPAIYRYFKNKESLFFAVVNRGMVILRDTFKDAVTNEKTGIEKVSAFIQALCFDYVVKHYDYYRLLVVAHEQRFMDMVKKKEIDGESQLGNMELEWLSFLIDALNLGIEDGTIREDVAPLQTAIFLVVACEAEVKMIPEYQSLLIQTGLGKDEYLKHSLDLMLRGIAAKSPEKQK